MKKNNDKNDEDRESLKRYRDIENGKVLPTLIEFFKICIVFGIGECVNLKELYPVLYKELKKEIDLRSKLLEKKSETKKKKVVKKQARKK